PAEVAALARLPNLSNQLRANFVKRFPDAAAWLSRSPRALGSSYCIATNPGTPIDTLFWDPINSGEIAGHYKSLVAAIKERGMRAGKVPRIIYTTYHQPLPSPAQSDECLDLGDLSRDEIDYLITLENALKSTIVAAVGSLEGVTIADI